MGSNNIVFVVSLTVVSLAWIYVFQLYVFKVVEQKTRNATILYGPKPTTIEGTFVYQMDMVESKLGNNVQRSFSIQQLNSTNVKIHLLLLILLN